MVLKARKSLKIVFAALLMVALLGTTGVTASAATPESTGPQKANECECGGGGAFDYVDTYYTSNFIEENTDAAILAAIAAVTPKYVAWIPAALSVYFAGGDYIYIKVDRYYDRSNLEWGYNYTYYTNSNYSGYVSSQWVEQYPAN
jgi:hypothetical protein